MGEGMGERNLDVIALGRSCVDLYGEQVGGTLEAMQSFAKYVGGTPTNIAVGTARLGLKSALITRVGNEPMGRFIRQTLADEGVDVTHVSTDPERLSALVILGIRDRQSFPHIFYRENCADRGLSEKHIDELFIASARALVITGTHLSSPGVEAASRAAIRYARAAGTRVVLDIDYRPTLWGLADHQAGEQRFVADSRVSKLLQSVLADCDLVVGTEEEVHIAGGDTDTRQALLNIRAATAAVIVLKQGPQGCVIYTGEIPQDLEQGIRGPGFEVEVFNTLGAGDAFMSGLLRGWLGGESWEKCCEFANASGAIVVSRHGCAPAIPSWEELVRFIEQGSKTWPLRHDAELNHLHHTTTRARQWPVLCALAFDHRAQLEEIAASSGVNRQHIPYFKSLLAQALLNMSREVAGLGAIVDGRYGADSLALLGGSGIWLARPVESPGSRPLQFEDGDNVGLALREWPREQVAKCLVFYHPDDAPTLRELQEERLKNLYDACLATSHELLVEVIPPAHSEVDDNTTARALDNLYRRGIMPDWWKLPGQKTAAAWEQIAGAIQRHDPSCRGVVILGLGASETELRRDFALAGKHDICRGFAVGRCIFQDAAEQWFAGNLDDAGVIAQISARYTRLVDSWMARRGQTK